MGFGYQDAASRWWQRWPLSAQAPYSPSFRMKWRATRTQPWREYPRTGRTQPKFGLVAQGMEEIEFLRCSPIQERGQLAYKAEEAGRQFLAVDPRYTSQTCSECGFVHKENRKTQADFECLSCGYKDHADHNGAVNIMARSEPSFDNISAVRLA